MSMTKSEIKAAVERAAELNAELQKIHRETGVVASTTFRGQTNFLILSAEAWKTLFAHSTGATAKIDDGYIIYDFSDDKAEYMAFEKIDAEVVG